MSSIALASTANGRFSCLLVSSTGVFSWGDNRHGQLGLGVTSSETIASPTPIASLLHHRVMTVHMCNSTDQTSEVHCAAVTANGHLFTWGSGRHYQLGAGHAVDSNTPRIVQALEGRQVVAASLGARFSACLTATGEVYYWGSATNPSPLLTPDDKSVLQLTVPTRGGGSALQRTCIKNVIAGPDELLLISDLGHCYHAGNLASRFAYNYRRYQLVRTLSPHFAVDAAIGDQSRFVLMADGSVYSYGKRSNALADGRFSDVFSLVAEDHKNVVEEANPARLLPRDLTSVAAFADRCCAVDAQGALWLWGGPHCVPRRVDALAGKAVSQVVIGGEGRCLLVCSEVVRRRPACTLRSSVARSLTDIPFAITIDDPDKCFLGGSVCLRWSRPLFAATPTSYSCHIILHRVDGGELGEHTTKIPTPMYCPTEGCHPHGFHVSDTVVVKLPRTPGRYQYQYVHVDAMKTARCLAHSPTLDVRRPSLTDLNFQLLVGNDGIHYAVEWPESLYRLTAFQPRLRISAPDSPEIPIVRPAIPRLTPMPPQPLGPFRFPGSYLVELEGGDQSQPSFRFAVEGTHIAAVPSSMQASPSRIQVGVDVNLAAAQRRSLQEERALRIEQAREQREARREERLAKREERHTERDDRRAQRAALLEARLGRS